MRNYYDQVRQILIEAPRARDDDMFLYALFCAKLHVVGKDETFYKVLASARQRRLPSYESVTRSRRKVQEAEPELTGERRGERKEEEEEYRKWYRDH